MWNWREAHMFYLVKEVGKFWRCSCCEKGNFIMINEFKYGQTWKIWPFPLSVSLYSTFNDNIDLHMPNLGTLVPEGPWCVFYATRIQVYWGLTHNVVCYWCSDLISHTQTHTDTHRHTHTLFKTTPPFYGENLNSPFFEML